MSDRELDEILSTLDLPPKRLDWHIPQNMGWLLRNAGIRNSSYPRMSEVMEELHIRMKAQAV
jgi:hypothetical protein